MLSYIRSITLLRFRLWPLCFVVQPSLAEFVLVSEVARDPDRDLRIQIVISGQLTDRVGSVQDTALV